MGWDTSEQMRWNGILWDEADGIDEGRWVLRLDYFLFSFDSNKLTMHSPPISFLYIANKRNDSMGWDAMGLKWKGWVGTKDSFVLI